MSTRIQIQSTNAIPARNTGRDWDAVKDVFKQLYWSEDMKLSDVMEVLAKEHGFEASVKQYKNQIAKWKLKKNVDDDEYRAIAWVRKRRLEEDNKATVFNVRGRPVSDENIDRFLKRKNIFDSHLQEPSVATLSDIDYSTPAPNPTEGPGSPWSASGPMVSVSDSLSLEGEEEGTGNLASLGGIVQPTSFSHPATTLEPNQSHEMELGESYNTDLEPITSGQTEAPSQSTYHAPNITHSSLDPQNTTTALDVSPAQTDVNLVGAACFETFRVPDSPSSQALRAVDEKLREAVRSGDLEAVRLALDEGASTEGLSEMGMTALHIATCHGHPRIAAELLDRGAALGAKVAGAFDVSVDTGNPLGGDCPKVRLVSPEALHIAAWRNDTCLMRLLFCPTHYNSSRDEPAISHTLYSLFMVLTNVQTLLLLASFIQPESVRRDILIDKLVFSSALGHEQVIAAITEYLGNRIDSLGMYQALCVAAAKGNAQIMEILMQGGATVSSDHPGPEIFLSRFAPQSPELPSSAMRWTTPLANAVRAGSAEAVTFILDNESEINAPAVYRYSDRPASTPLALACEMGNIEIAKLLVRRGADVNKTVGGISPLTRAVERRSLDLVKLLVEAGANPNHEPRAIFAPLRVAVQLCHHGDYRVIKFLLEHGADPNASGPGSLYYLSRRDPELARTLLEYGVDPNPDCDDSIRMVSQYIRSGDHRLVELLLKKAALANCRRGIPLVRTAVNRNLESSEALIRYDPDVDMPEPVLQQLTCAASIPGNAEPVRLLLESGANANAQQDTYSYALSRTIENGAGEETLPSCSGVRRGDLLGSGHAWGVTGTGESTSGWTNAKWAWP